VVATEADGAMVRWNGRAAVLYGWARDEAVGRHIGDLVVPETEQRAREAILGGVQRGEPWQGPFRLRRKDGGAFTAFVKYAPIVNGTDRLVGIVGVSIEIGDAELAQAVRTQLDGHHPKSGRRTRTLSPREREVLGLLA